MQESAPTISVIIPCYNGARFLRETLASALGQTRPPLEVIVVDDGSTDDSAAIAESFGPPVRVIRQANQGESKARNVGLRQSRGKYVLFLDSDAMISRSSVARLVERMESDPTVGIAGCRIVDPATRALDQWI